MSALGIAQHGVLLAGGAGSRLGSRKTLAELAGRPLIDFPLAAMRAAGLRVTIVAKFDTELPADCAGENAAQPEIRVIREADTPQHALLGIVTALETLAEPIVVCACDMPFVTGELLAWIAGIDEAPVVAPCRDDIVDPLLGRYTPTALPALRAALAAGASARAGVQAAGLREITELELARFGEPDRLLFDVDTPEDLERATRMLELARAAAPSG